MFQRVKPVITISAAVLLLTTAGWARAQDRAQDRSQDDKADTAPSAPARPRLNDCYPNPFNPQTLISFEMPATGRARLEVYTLDGRKIAVLVDEEVATGRHEEIWYGKDDSGQRQPSGVYFYRLQTEDFSDSKRMVLLK